MRCTAGRPMRLVSCHAKSLTLYVDRRDTVWPRPEPRQELFQLQSGQRCHRVPPHLSGVTFPRVNRRRVQCPLSPPNKLRTVVHRHQECHTRAIEQAPRTPKLHQMQSSAESSMALLSLDFAGALRRLLGTRERLLVLLLIARCVDVGLGWLRFFLLRLHGVRDACAIETGNVLAHCSQGLVDSGRCLEQCCVLFDREGDPLPQQLAPVSRAMSSDLMQRAPSFQAASCCLSRSIRGY